MEDPMIARARVHVLPVDRWADDLPVGVLLDDEDRRRHDTFRHVGDRRLLLASRALLRSALAEWTGIPPQQQRFVRHCVVCGLRHGRPRLLGVDDDPTADPATFHTPHASISHTANVTVVAVAAHPVGVDVETEEATAFEGFAEAALTAPEAAELASMAPAEAARARALWWTRKEAVLKAMGHGLAIEPTHLRVTPPGEPPALVGWTSSTTSPPTVAMADVPVPETYAASVAVLHRQRLRVEVRDVEPGVLLTP